VTDPAPVRLAIPALSLVALVGPSGAGKSTFARRHFRPTEVLSSDACRGLVGDDETDQAATADAFAVLHFIAGKRLARGRLTVIDATNVQPEGRKPLVELARRYHVLPVAVVFDLPESVCQRRNQGRPDRAFGPHVVRQHVQQLRRSLGGLEREGFRKVFVLSSPEEAEAAAVERVPLWVDRRGDHGPFDIIGDVHGCFEELTGLLGQLGYALTPAADGLTAQPPAGRKEVFVGDLVDRGPDTPGVLKLAMNMVEAGAALCVPGNHDNKLLRKLLGRNVQVAHGLAESLEQLAREPPEFLGRVKRFLDGLVSHYVLDGGKLVVAHAGLTEELQGRASGRVREFAMYGETTGETDEFGLPVRFNWAGDYRGRATVVYGHTPVVEPQWLNRTICIDTGCVFGGRLTALRYPENKLVSVPAARTYCEPKRPLQPPTGLTAQQEADDVLDMADVLGKRRVEARLHPPITVREENALAALEVLSRFAADPKWLIFLPPTISPVETSAHPDFLERPEEAFAYFEREGIARVVCETKHMGSRAVVIVCRDEAAARRRFGVTEGAGVCCTRTGRRFFDEPAVEAEVLAGVRSACDGAGFWERFETDWACLDAELLPWSAKAGELLRRQYAAVGSAARAALAEAVPLLDRAAEVVPDAAGLRDRTRERQAAALRYVEEYRRYCWPVRSVADLRLAPFHLLATEGKVHADRDHLWHLERLAELCAARPDRLLATPFRAVDLADPASRAEGGRWWEELTAAGNEGMVVKPLAFVPWEGASSGPERRRTQPALKVRGREYLRIIYGPEYTLPENLARLRERGLGAKRSLALREFALGVEGLERFVRREPLRRTHECVLAVLALESEPIDPRL
jgi:protein phosphatase